jgi:hypothetical protein
MAKQHQRAQAESQSVCVFERESVIEHKSIRQFDRVLMRAESPRQRLKSNTLATKSKCVFSEVNPGEVGAD